MKVNLGKIKKGTKYINLIWPETYGKEIIPSTTTAIVCKNPNNRKIYLHNAFKNVPNALTVGINVNGLDTVESEVISLLETVKKYLLGEIPIKDIFKSCEKDFNEIIIVLDEYDFELHKSPKLASLINFINDVGKDKGVFLVLGMSNVSESVESFLLNYVDNIILLPPYHLKLLKKLFNDSIYEIIDPSAPIQPFCKANGLVIDQVTKEPAVFKNDNCIYPFKKLEDKKP